MSESSDIQGITKLSSLLRDVLGRRRLHPSETNVAQIKLVVSRGGVVFNRIF